MISPMANLLDALIEESEDEEGAEVQITFRPGITTTAGILRKGPVSDTYCLGTASRATADTPGDFHPGDVVVIEQLFQADAVQTVARMMVQETPLILPVGGHA